MRLDRSRLGRARIAVTLGLSLAGSTAAAAQRPPLADSLHQYLAVSEPVVALTHVRLIDGTGQGPAADQTVLIADGRIRAVGPTASTLIPDGARVLDLRDHTVVPGFAGLHNHTFYTTSGRRAQLTFSAPRLYLASGVTTIRTTGSISPYAEITLKQQINRGDAVGPRMHISGPYITGPDDVVERKHVTTPEEARRVVDYWAEEGATWFKVYTQISRENLRAVTEAAHRRGVKVTGHLCSVGYREAVEAGIDALEHGLLANLEYHPSKVPDQCPARDIASYSVLDVQSPAVQATFRDMIRAGVAMTSTLAVYEAFIANRPPLLQRTLDAMSPAVREEYLSSRRALAENPGRGFTERMLHKSMEYERAFVAAGGLLAAGVDPTGNGGALPGYGDQRNYELLIEAGFAPAEVVRILSANGATVLGVAEEQGTVTAGKVADLVVMQGDLAADPTVVRNVTIVFKDGYGFDSAKLIESVRGLVGVR